MQVLARLHSLCLYPHLDNDVWAAWKADVVALSECLQGAMHHMQNHAARVQEHSRKQVQGSLTRATLDVTSSGIDFHDATLSVHRRYTELEKVLRTYAEYSPLSLTFFEPANVSERFYWLQNLRLSFPVALVKVAIGGSDTSAHWAY